MPQLPPNSRKLTARAKERARKFRKESTASESVMWEMVRTIGFKFRRQHFVDPYTLDFYCAEARLCVEVDGPMHSVKKDLDRDEFLCSLGIQTIRVPSLELFEDTHTAKSAWQSFILDVCEARAGRKVFESPARRHTLHLRKDDS